MLRAFYINVYTSVYTKIESVPSAILVFTNFKQILTVQTMSEIMSFIHSSLPQWYLPQLRTVIHIKLQLNYIWT